jgi:hypothetical protein
MLWHVAQKHLSTSTDLQTYPSHEFHAYRFDPRWKFFFSRRNDPQCCTFFFCSTATQMTRLGISIHYTTELDTQRYPQARAPTTTNHDIHQIKRYEGKSQTGVAQQKWNMINAESFDSIQRPCSFTNCFIEDTRKNAVSQIASSSILQAGWAIQACRTSHVEFVFDG